MQHGPGGRYVKAYFDRPPVWKPAYRARARADGTRVYAIHVRIPRSRVCRIAKVASTDPGVIARYSVSRVSRTGGPLASTAANLSAAFITRKLSSGGTGREEREREKEKKIKR